MSATLTHEGTQVAETNAAGYGLLRTVWHRIRTTVQEMNYASRRVVELQAPWIAGK
jgi:hypothetical protein